MRPCVPPLEMFIWIGQKGGGSARRAECLYLLVLYHTEWLITASTLFPISRRASLVGPETKRPGARSHLSLLTKRKNAANVNAIWRGSIFTRTRRAPFVITSTHLRFRLQHSRNEFCCRDVSLIAHRAHSFCMCSVLRRRESVCVAWCISASFIFSLWSAQF